MPQQKAYSRKDVIAAFRADNPDAAHIDDNKIWAAIAVEDPDLAKGISELHQPEYKSPEPSRGPLADKALSQMDAAGKAILGLPAAMLNGLKARDYTKAATPAEATGGIRGLMKAGGDLVGDTVALADNVTGGRLGLPAWASKDEDQAAYAGAAGQNLLMTTAGAIPQSPMVSGAVSDVVSSAPVKNAVGSAAEFAAKRAATLREPLSATDMTNILPRATRKAAVGTVGTMVGGPLGGVTAEAADAAWQSQLARNARASLYEKAADFMTKGDVAPDMGNPQLGSQAFDPKLLAYEAQKTGKPVESGRDIPRVPADQRSAPSTDNFQAVQDQLRDVAAEPTVYKPAPDTGLPTMSKVTAAHPLKSVEEAIAPLGKGKGTVQMFDVEGTPTRFGGKLLEVVPEIGGATKETAPAILKRSLDVTGKQIETAESAIPDATPINPEPIADKIAAIIEDYAGDERSVAQLSREWDRWAGQKTVPWSEFIKIKRNLGKNLTSPALRRAYRALVEASTEVSEDLRTANENYSTVRRAMESGGISAKTGRRIADVGRAIKP